MSQPREFGKAIDPAHCSGRMDSSGNRGSPDEKFGNQQRVDMSSPHLTKLELDAVSKVLHSKTLSLGRNLKSFEDSLAQFVGAQFAVGVNSGTSGLHLAMIAAGVGENDLVLTTPFSFVASANCILYENGIPIFIDVEPSTGNIDSEEFLEAGEALVSGSYRQWLPRSLEGKQATIGQLKAVLPVHVFGQPAEMEPILDWSSRHGIAVVEDACEALGAEYKGRRVGSLGDCAAFGFYPNKQITTGEGGMITTNKKEWFDLFNSLRNQGRDRLNAWLAHDRLGFNYRLDEMSAALGATQLRRIEEILACRQRIADGYSERLSECELVELPRISESTTRMSWFVYVVRILPPANRNAVMSKLLEMGIPSRPYFSPIHLQPYYQRMFGYRAGDFPITEHLADISLALPFSGVMSDEEVDMVCQCLQQAIEASV